VRKNRNGRTINNHLSNDYQCFIGRAMQFTNSISHLRRYVKNDFKCDRKQVNKVDGKQISRLYSDNAPKRIHMIARRYIE
jgi:hypothetical protein